MRFFDVLFSLVGLVAGFPVFLCLLVAGYFDTGAPLFRQERVGRGGQSFTLVKFRTMTVGTASVATHLAHASSVTRFGRFLRKTKLDELPQLWNVLVGDMSIVGPRPCLPVQAELVSLRKRLGVLDVRPGITGLAQLRGIDMSTPEELARTDALMLEQLSLFHYFVYIFQTAAGKGSGDRVKNG